MVRGSVFGRLYMYTRQRNHVNFRKLPEWITFPYSNDLAMEDSFL